MKFPEIEKYKEHFNDRLWHRAAKIICEKHDLEFDSLRRADDGESVVFSVDENYIVKIYIPGKNGLKREKLALETARTSLKIPEVVGFGSLENFDYLITTQIAGELMRREMWLKLETCEQLNVLEQLAAGLLQLHELSDASKIDFDWQRFIEKQAETCLERQRKCQVNLQILRRIPEYLEENLPLLMTETKPVLLHGDVHFGNLRLMQKSGKWEISGLFDFADSLKGAPEYDFLAVGLLMIQGQGDLQKEFFRFFGYADAEINENLRKRLMLLTMFYEWSDLRRYAIRLRPEAVDYPLDRLEKEIWNFA